MKKLVKYPGFTPGVLIGRFKEKGVWYVRVEWTNLPSGERYWNKRAPRTGVFPEKDCKIYRVKTKLERNIIKFFKKFFKKK